MAEFSYPKLEDPKVKAALKAHKVVKHLVIGSHRKDSDHIDDKKACSVFEAKGLPIGKTTVEVCIEGSQVSVHVPFDKSHLNKTPLPSRPGVK